MQINYLIYKNITEDYEIKRVDFLKTLTLLVGASGAGKTQILRALDVLAEFALGGSIKNPVAFEAELGFTISNEQSYVWKVKTSLNDERTSSNEKQLKVLYESLELNPKETIFERTDNAVVFLDYGEVPMSKENESLISQYRNQSSMVSIFLEFFQIQLCDLEWDLEKLTSPSFFMDSNQKQKLNLELAIHRSESSIFSPFERYGVMKVIQLPKYEEIHSKALELYQDIFPTVQDIDYIQNEMGDYGMAILTNDHWVMQQNISTGMLKTLWHILNILTAPKGAVILLDEFENGLGVNCIDVVSNLIIEERQDIQIVMTSHHPYIINRIPMHNWLITKRFNKQVQVYSAKDYHLGQSKHDAYIELMNRLVQDEME